VRRSLLLVALLAPLALTAEAPAAVRTFPGCGATLAACANSSPAGTTIRLRTNALIPIPDTFVITKGLRFTAAPGFRPRIGRTAGQPAFIALSPSQPNQTFSFRGITFRQAKVVLELNSGTGHRLIFERNVVHLVSANGEAAVSAWFGGTSSGTAAIRDNDVRSTGSAIVLRLQGGSTVVSGNRITASVLAESHAGIELYGAEVVSNALLANNLVHRVGGCGCGNPAGINVSVFDGGTLNVRLLNNTVANLSLSGFARGLDARPSAGATLNVALFGNTFSGTAKGMNVASAGGTVTGTGDRNNSFGNTNPDDVGSLDLGTTFALDPKFANPAAGNYRLGKGSPLANRGASCVPGGPLPRSDAAGKFRFAGRGVDIGAYERGSSLPGTVSGRSRNGTAGDNVLKGTAGVDVLCGLDGNDRLEGLGGRDFLFGGAGADRLFGGGEPDLLDVRDGVGGNDRVNGGAGKDACLRDAGDIATACP
jgi:Ca2+-binding RTX toxin-like protein